MVGVQHKMVTKEKFLKALDCSETGKGFLLSHRIASFSVGESVANAHDSDFIPFLVLGKGSAQPNI